MQTFLTIFSLSFSFLAGLVLLFDWFDVITRFQLSRNDADIRSAFKLTEKTEREFEKHLVGKVVPGNFYLVGALYGLFVAQRMNVAAYDKLHQMFRRSFELDEFSLQEKDGFLSRERVQASFDEIRSAIVYCRDNFEQRDLRPLVFWLQMVSFASGLSAAVV